MVGSTAHPVSFSALRGQEKGKKILQRVIGSGRMSHAYLFRGPDGVGKRFCAQLVAAYLNCHHPSEDGGCSACPSCRKYLSGSHPDITLVSPEYGVIKIDRIRELCRSLSYPPYESAVRVVILEDIHSMRQEAANALLKTLEEPPENNILILTAESSRAILPTIISRCQVIPFYGLTASQTAEILGGLYPDMVPADAAALAAISDGSPGKGILLSEQGVIEAWALVLQVISSHPGESAGATTQVLQVAEHIGALKEHLLPLFGLIRGWIRDRMCGLEIGSKAEWEQQRARLAALVQAERMLAVNCNRTLVCEVLLFNLQSSDPGVS